MKFTFRLLEILKDRKEKTRGLIQKIAARTGLERHQVAAMLYNKTQYISQEALGRICDFLVQEYKIDPQLLPGILFSRSAEDFWTLLAQRGSLTLCLGMREEDGEAWVTEADAYLQGTFLHGVSNPAVTDRHIVSLDQHLITAPNLQGEVLERDKVEALYRQFADGGSGCALVALGSIKINPIMELIAASCFRAEPFARAEVEQPRQRRCPFLFVYRDEDPQVAACCGDSRLALARPLSKPGIHYEKKNGHWAASPWDKHHHDAALVFFDHQPNQGRVQMVLAGFSARSSRCLADVLATHPARLWPPSYATPKRQVGVFIVEFQFDPRKPNKPSDTNVISLDRDVLARRLEKSRSNEEEP